MDKTIIVGNVADNHFAEDIASHLNQSTNYSDLISLKVFLNTEFCPRFIPENKDLINIGRKLNNKDILIVSTSFGQFSRNELAMRNFLIARAARDNGANRIILLEPDLYYSAQDRGPNPGQGIVKHKRDVEDFKKFDGQAFSSRLYADLLKEAGIDEVVTVHNHSFSVKNIFRDRFKGKFYNILPSSVYANYILDSDIVNQKDDLVICAPDEGAYEFAREVKKKINNKNTKLLIMSKKRMGERDVSIDVSEKSTMDISCVKGKNVIVVDDMVRTGSTIVNCCNLLKKENPAKIIFFVTHFYASHEGRINMNDPSIDEIVTTDTIPQILNRDMRGRLRHKLVVLRISRWIASHLMQTLGGDSVPDKRALYIEDMSSKNPRWKGKLGPLFSSNY